LSLGPRSAPFITLERFRRLLESGTCCETGFETEVRAATAHIDRILERILQIFFVIHNCGRYRGLTGNFPANLHLRRVELTVRILTDGAPIQCIEVRPEALVSMVSIRISLENVVAGADVLYVGEFCAALGKL